MLTAKSLSRATIALCYTPNFTLYYRILLKKNNKKIERYWCVPDMTTHKKVVKNVQLFV